MEIDKIRNNAENYGVPIIRTESHDFLQKIVLNEKPQNILEIGTAVGYSGIAMLSVYKNSNLTTIEHEPKLVKQAKKNFAKNGFKKQVKIIEGDCLVEIAKMIASGNFDNHFDMIFLDGPKAQYNSLLELLLIVLKPNGVLVADNVLFRGYTENENLAPTKRYKTIIKRLNEFIENCKNHQLLTDFQLNNIEDGIIFARKVQNEK